MVEQPRAGRRAAVPIPFVGLPNGLPAPVVPPHINPNAPFILIAPNGNMNAQQAVNPNQGA